MTEPDLEVPQPRVTIGIPCHGRPDLLREALQSALDQTYTAIEVLVHENPSDVEGIPDAVAEVARDDPRVFFHRHESNIGPNGNFNSVLERANGRYFMWLADDDLLSRNYVAHLVSLLEDNASAGSAFGSVGILDSRGQEVAEFLDFSCFAARDQAVRISRFLAEPEILGKANMIYGLHRIEACREIWNSFFREFDSNSLSHYGADVVFVFGLLARNPWVFAQSARLTKRIPKVSKRGYWHLVYEDFGPALKHFEAYIADLREISPDVATRQIVDDVMTRRLWRERLVSSWRRPLLRLVEHGLVHSALAPRSIRRR